MSNSASCDGQKVNRTAISSALENPSVKSFLGGTISGLTSCILLQPLDLLKTRIQAARSVSVPPTHSSAGRGRGLITVTISVVRNERIFGLWRGLTPSLVRTVPGVGLYFLSLHAIQTKCGWDKLTVSQGLFAGTLSRCIASTSLLPITVVKTRYESEFYKYKSVIGALQNIFKLEGYRGLYSGLTATLLRDAPFSGLYLAFYSQAKMLAWSASIQMTMPVHFACGISAGILASTVTQPFDVIKTHMQLHPSVHHSFLATLRAIVKSHGIRGLFAGMVPRCLRRTLMAALTWTVYEEVKVKLNLK